MPQHNNVFLLALTNKNSNVCLILVFLYQLVSVRSSAVCQVLWSSAPLTLVSPLCRHDRPLPQVFKEYFGTLEEESIRDNFVVIYELLDEVMDFGWPQVTETKILKEFIMQVGNKLERAQPSLPPQAVRRWPCRVFTRRPCVAGMCQLRAAC